MRRVRKVSVVAFCVLGLAASRADAQLFPIPLRINMGGQELRDSLGRLWLGDGAQAGDQLNIRPDDGGGTNFIENWCVADSQFQSDSLENLLFDAFDVNDQLIFNTIRWDLGTDAVDFRLEIPIPNGSYTVNCYFTECCCVNRHFKIEIQGEIVDDDVSYLDYDPDFPALGRTGRLSFEDIVVDNEVLAIGFLPCPECPGATDTNAIIDAIEVISSSDCDQFGLDFNCEFDAANDAVTGSWNGIDGADGYRVLKNGEPLGGPLGPNATFFEDEEPRSGGTRPEYRLEALSGGNVISSCLCSVNAFSCHRNLECTVVEGSTEVALSWDPAGGIEVVATEIWRNDEMLQTLPGDATTFEDEPDVRGVEYRVVLITDPPGQCADLVCNVVVKSLRFDTPLRINMGGPELVDSRGRLWLGDRNVGDPEAADPLGIRVDPLGGTQSLINWCAVEPNSLAKIGLDPADPNDQSIMGTIRWDQGADGIDFEMELPILNDTYLVNLYFNECCCTNRRFQIELEGELVDEDVGYLDYDSVPALTKVGRLSFSDIIVEDDSLSIALRPCFDCVLPGGGGIDGNAILNAIEVLSETNLCEDPEFSQCPGNISCSVSATREATLSWAPPLCIDVTGFTVLRNGEEIAILPANATTFEDETPTRVTTYEVVTNSAAGEPQCPPLTCTVTCACPSNIFCETDGFGSAMLSWDPPGCEGILEGYEVRRNGELVATLAGDAIDFEDSFEGRVASYEVVPLVAEGQAPCGALRCDLLNPGEPFDIPLRINMGGVTAVDSRGQLWFGDQPDPGDFLEIRVDDFGGTNFIQNWCVVSSQANADAMQSLGLDPFNASDQLIYNTIRWDVGDDDGDFIAGEVADIDGGDIDFVMQIPVPEGNYLVNMFFTECCCPNRHFQIEIQGELVADDVSSASYSAIDSLGRTGRLSFDDIAVGGDEILEIALRPCFLDCPDATDFNAIVDAIEVVPAGTDVQTCPRDLVCTIDNGTVTGTWSPPENVTVTGYELFRDGDKIRDLPAGATTFSDPIVGCQRLTFYELRPIFPAGEEFCPEALRLRCRLLDPECPFTSPLRINLGGPEIVDSRGDVWLADRLPGDPEAADPLDIRPDDNGGSRSLINWCAPAPDTVEKLGFDPTNAADLSLLGTIRWDVGGDGVDFLLEIPIEDNVYDVNLYFNECCCTNRHFKISLEDEIVDDDVSYLDYDDSPALTRAGRLSFEDIEVADGFLSVGFLPCPECPGAADTNAIVNAIEVIATDEPPPPPQRFVRGDVDASGAINIADAIRIFGFLFLGDPDLPCFDAADPNDDGSINLTDGVYVLLWLFQSGNPPREPGPTESNWLAAGGKADCGVDPSPDAGGVDLTCLSFPACDD